MLFEYEAAEENEMSLIEGEILEQVDQIDEGWWSAVGDGGAKSGLFPANYVELLPEEAGMAAAPQAPRTSFSWLKVVVLLM